MKKSLLFQLILLSALAQAQTTEPTVSFDKQYFAAASEAIFSMGDLGKVTVSPAINGPHGSSQNAEPIPRFSLFFHVGEQMHFNFSNSLGLYTGINLRNIGMINRFNDSLKVKQRVYSVGVPLALKLGNMGKRAYVAVGGELELFFHYKQKVFEGTSSRGEKVDKYSAWFSNRTPLINPSVFVEFNFGKGNYVRLRYYLKDFLVNGNQFVRVSGTKLPFSVERSTLFALSVGRIIKHK
jgi:hypothetical protein